jgi:hypothetical protein
MANWEYTLIPTVQPRADATPTWQSAIEAARDQVSTALNERGAQGWEAVGSISVSAEGLNVRSPFVLMKRPKP